MAATNSLPRAVSGWLTTAAGIRWGVGLAIAYVYEPAKSPAAAARMNSRTVAGK